MLPCDTQEPVPVGREFSLGGWTERRRALPRAPAGPGQADDSRGEAWSL